MLPLLGNTPLIALVSNSTWSLFNFRRDIIRMLLRDGFRVLVIAPEDEYAQELILMGCSYEPIVFNNRTTNPLEDLQLYWKLRQLYRRHRPGFIFHYVAKPNIYGTLAARRWNIPSVAVITGLGYAFSRKDLLNRFIRKVYKFSLSFATEAWFLNNDDANLFTQSKLVDIRKVKVLPGEGVNTEFFQPVYAEKPGARFQFLMVTRLLRSKGVALYADAARILKKKGFDAEYKLIGFFEPHHPDSISRSELQAWQDEGLLTYLGFASDVREHLAYADCFVFPSFYNEGVPRCIMEAASMGLPVITSANRGCREVIRHFETGFLCKKNDAFDLSEKMEWMMQVSDEKRRKMGLNGRQLMVDKFSVEHIYREYQLTLQGDAGD